MKNFDRHTLSQVLAEGIAEMKLDVTPAQQEKLLDYLALMFKWNSVYNLTSLRDPMQMVTHHLLDSLAAVPAFADSKNVLDVGSGGGLPGIVLAVVRPDMKVSMIDTVHKKTAFLTQVKAQLGLVNVSIYTMKVQELTVSDKFDVITSRAFADLSDFVNWSSHLLAEQGRYIALKGTAPQDEQQRLPAEWKVTKVEPLQVPRLGAERHLVHIEKMRQKSE
ncbi:Ribosomal RNA small subunit methyltransferase G [Massilia sp. Bi118]|uniref:16S rRNA (guanine(527)-N(7))-methyltransferase RsmG n=1 Tax=Massilia sp. Bi118 TaxID=2822346 RepID=UPI001D5FA98D|nr:16S rRNA (guanine(527)-N(7))-methyltransferase RsmG [Massilia sp. Bi118]CAH0222252.1 Ribosomal RNA small subunit methyltransferase G [Massilia sp. Bi118]